MSEAKIRERDVEQIVAQLNALVEELEQYPDSEAREKALDVVQSILELYGEALRRILATIDALPLKEQILSRMIKDDVIRAVMLIHGLMPIELMSRVAAVLDHLRPYLLSQGGDVELLGVEEGRARLRLIRNGKGAQPVAALKLEIENALNEAAPDLLGIDIEGITDAFKPTEKA